MTYFIISPPFVLRAHLKIFSLFILEENVEQQNREPHLYQGGAIPSRSFKILQSMTQPENAGEFQNSKYLRGISLAASSMPPCVLLNEK